MITGFYGDGGNRTRGRFLPKIALACGILLLFAAPANAAPPYTVASDQTNCLGRDISVNDFLAEHGANVMRVAVSPVRAGGGLDCIRAAYNAGIRIFLDLQWDNTWTPEQASKRFGEMLGPYVPYVWAVGIGGEQEFAHMTRGDDHGPLPATLGGRSQVCAAHRAMDAVAHYSTHRVRYRVRVRHRHRVHRRWRTFWRMQWRLRTVVTRNVAYVPHTVTACRPSSFGEDYRTYWDAIEPVVARMAPDAIRVYGEGAPGSMGYVMDGFAQSAPPGVGAIGLHCYHAGGGLEGVPMFAAWARGQGVPLWCSEQAPAIHGSNPWIVKDSQGSWDQLVARVERDAPNLQMDGFYNWPSL